MAAVVPIARLQRDREEITWAITLVGFFFITAPGLVPRRDISRVIRAARAGAGLSLLWMGFFRIGSIAYGSLSEPTPDNLSSFPFCALRNKAFGIPFIIIGVFASILSVRGVFIFYGDEFGEDCCWGIFRRADGPREDTSPVSVRIDGRWQQIPRHFLEPRMPDIPRYA